MQQNRNTQEVNMMFKKHTALVAAILLASGMTTSVAECTMQQDCKATCGT